MERYRTYGRRLRTTGLLAVSLLTGGCMGLQPSARTYAPQTARVVLARSADQGYRCAYTTFTAQSWGQVTAADATVHTFQGQVHNAVAMTVRVDPASEGCVVDIHGMVLANKQVTGDFTEVQEFAARVAECNR